MPEIGTETVYQVQYPDAPDLWVDVSREVYVTVERLAGYDMPPDGEPANLGFRVRVHNGVVSGRVLRPGASIFEPPAI